MKNESIISNSKIKTLLALQKKSKIRNDKKIFLVEGIKEIKMAINGGYIPEEAFICIELYNNNKEFLNFFKKKTFISLKVFTKLVYRDNSGGIIVIFKQKKFCTLEQIQLSSNPLILIIEKIEKPGNIGAIFRTADAASVDIVILDKKIDLYNPNIIRSSLGSVFIINKIKESFNKIFCWLKNKNIKIIATCLKQDAKNIYKIDLSTSIAIIIGNETIGLSKKWLKNANKIVKIPMYGTVDSLNVSNAAAIIIFEAIRQRFFKE
ncbi:MAG: RNA methyltransferase [Candidatus Bostrichicola ureolyticus]|nr:MAG: RNA methyltransferase [Candidatus Bostrichicola ureolyticus]